MTRGCEQRKNRSSMLQNLAPSPGDCSTANSNARHPNKSLRHPNKVRWKAKKKRGKKKIYIYEFSGNKGTYSVISKPVTESVTEFFFLSRRSFQWWKSAVNRHRSRERETVAFCVSQKWCRILLRGISAVHIVLVVFLRFFLPKAGSVGHQCVRGWGLGEEEFSVSWNLLQRGISALVIVFLCTVRVYTCLCVSLQRDT